MMQSKTSSSWPAWPAATVTGLLIGAIDFLAPHPWPVLVLALLAGIVAGTFAPDTRWKLAVYIGLCVPVAITAGMALHQRPTRGHFVLVDARAVLPALIGAGIGGWLYNRSSGRSLQLKDRP
jgi:hypothetical protein